MAIGWRIYRIGICPDRDIGGCQTFSQFNPNQVVGDATIEAIVQRVPDPVDPDNDDIDDSIQRKFKIMSVRWLTQDEI